MVQESGFVSPAQAHTGLRLADPGLEPFSSRSLPFEFSAASDGGFGGVDRSINSSRSDGPRTNISAPPKHAWEPKLFQSSQLEESLSSRAITPSPSPIYPTIGQPTPGAWLPSMPATQKPLADESTQDYLAACEGYVLEYNRLGRIALGKGDLQQADATFRQALELVQKDLVSKKHLAAMTYNNIGCLWRRKELPQKALDVLEKALAIMANQPELPRELLPQLDLVDLHLNMSAVLSQLGRHDGALTHVETAVSLLYERNGGAASVLVDAPRKTERDLRLLAIAHYNCGAEQQFLALQRESLMSFQAALDLSENYLAPQDPLHLAIRRAHAKALHAASGRPTLVAASVDPSRRRPPHHPSRSADAHPLSDRAGLRGAHAQGSAIPPLRLSHLHGSTEADASATEVQPAAWAHAHPRAGTGPRLPREEVGGAGKSNPFGLSAPVMGGGGLSWGGARGADGSQSSSSSVRRGGGGSSGRSQLTPEGWHVLHGVPRGGSWGAAARVSERREREGEGGGGGRGRKGMQDVDGGDREGRRVRAKDGGEQGKAGWGQGTPGASARGWGRVEKGVDAAGRRRGSEGRRVKLTDSQVQTTKAAGAGEGRRGSEDSSVSAEVGLQGASDVVALLRAAPLHRRSAAASRYLPAGSRVGGLFDYETALAQSLMRSADAATQVEPRGDGGGGSARREGAPGRAGEGRRGAGEGQMEALLEEMIWTEASQLRRAQRSLAHTAPLPGRAGERDQGWGEEEGAGGGGRGVSGAERTYRGHLQRTREAQQRYDAVATVLQMAFRSHVARRAARTLKRNPRHLRSMYVNQIHAFAALVQSNARCYLARLRVGRLGAQRRRGEEAEWRQRRFRAALRVQTWWVLTSRRLARKRDVSGWFTAKAQAVLAGAWRGCRARRAVEGLRGERVQGILSRCDALEEASASAIQRAARGRQARERMRRMRELLAGEGEYRRMQAAASHAVGSLFKGLSFRGLPGQVVLAGQGAGISGHARRLARKQQERAAAAMQTLFASTMNRRAAHEAAARRRREREARAATRVQCAARGWRARRAAAAALRGREREALEARAEAAAGAIQRAVMCCWARRRAAAVEEAMVARVVGAAAGALQRALRCRSAREEVRRRLRHREYVAGQQRRRGELAGRVQRALRCHWAREAAVAAWRERRTAEAALRVQLAGRAWLARNDFQAQALAFHQQQMHSAALQLQLWAFANPRVRERPLVEFWRGRRERAAGRIGAVWRGHRARERVGVALGRERAERGAVAVQRVARGHRARRAVAARWAATVAEREARAASVVQRAWRGRVARRRAGEVREQMAQRWRRMQELHLQRQQAAVQTLQRAARAAVGREAVRPMVAARVQGARGRLQRVARGRLGRRRAAERGEEVRELASRRLQRAYRVHLEREWLRQMLRYQRMLPVIREQQRRLAAADTIQRAFLMHCARLVLRDRAQDLLLAALRRAVARRRHRRRLAAASLQTAARRTRAAPGWRRARAAWHLAARLRAGVVLRARRAALAGSTLSAAALCSLTRSNLRRKLAADTLAAAARGRLVWERYARKLAADTLAAGARRGVWNRRCRAVLGARALQRMARGLCGRLRTRVAMGAALRLQSTYRGHLDRVWWRAHTAALEKARERVVATIQLQAVYKGHLARIYAASVRLRLLRETAARRLQAGARCGERGREHAERLRLLFLGERAGEMQRWVRGALGREEVARMREAIRREAAAVEVQRCVRGHGGRGAMRRREREVEEERAARTMNRVARGFLGRERARAEARRQLEERSATVIAAGARGMRGRAEARARRLARLKEWCAGFIQAWVRGCWGRAEGNRRRLERRRWLSATRLQACQRGHEGRKQAELVRARLAFERELRWEMATRIQANWRQHEARKRMVTATEEAAEREFLQNWYAVELQSTVRQFLARAARRGRRAGIVFLQALWRRQLARKKAEKRRQLFKRDRAYTPPHIARPDCYELPPGTNLTIACRKPKPPKKFRAEARPEQLRKQPSGPDVKQQRVVATFQRNPNIQSFFTGLQKRGVSPPAHAKPRLDPRASAPPPPAAAPSAAAARPRSQLKPARDASPAPAPPPGIGQGVKGRLPPRFAKTRGGGGGGAAAAAGGEAGGGKPSKRPARQRPRARGSDSERDSDADLGAPPAAPAAPARAPHPTAPFPAAGSPPRRPPAYDKDAISDDPQSDDARKPRKSRTKSTSPSKPAPAPAPAPLEREPSRRSRTPEKAASEASRDKSRSKSRPPPEERDKKPDKVEAAFRSCLMGKYHEVEQALEEGVGVDARHGPEGNTMLLVCAANGQKRIAKHLLRNRADINAVNNAGNSALHLAFQVNYKELGEYLRSKGANDTLRNQRGQTCYEMQRR